MPFNYFRKRAPLQMFDGAQNKSLRNCSEKQLFWKISLYSEEIYKLTLVAIRFHHGCISGNSAKLFRASVFLSRRNFTEMRYLRDNTRKNIPYHIFLPGLCSQHQLGSVPLSHDWLFGTINTMM